MAAGKGELHTEMLYGATEARLQPYTLRVVSGQATPAAVELGPSSLSVGQSEASDLRVQDPTVSRFHFELVREAGQLVLRDLGSTNGTLVEGVRVREAVVAPGQRIQAGRSQFVVDTGAAPRREEAYPQGRFGALVGSSEVMRLLFARMERAARTDATVLIHGETGTGKELVAEEIHRHSARARGPFVIVDCGALPEDLIESELFGHEKGAFTGAAQERAGALEAAHGGTLFLDEIGELPLSLQPRLLRALESRTVKRLGSNQRRPIDLRFVAATHRNLRSEVNQGSFREDLFWRLAVVELRVPPLRERRDDLPELLAALWQRTGLEVADSPFDAETVARLQAQPWHGNVRELRNVVERAAVLGAADLPAQTLETRRGGEALPALRTDLPFKQAKELWTDHFERRYLEERLLAAEGNLSRLARETEIGRAHVLKLLRKHELK